MPPITDPALLAQIKQQQMGQPQQGIAPQTLAGPAPAMPPIIPNGQVIQPTNIAAVNHTNTEDNLTRQTTPAKISEANSNAEIAKLNLRQLRIKQGLDPDTGQPPKVPQSMGPDALAKLSPEDQTAVKSILSGRTPLTPYMLTRSPDYQRLWSIAQQVEPDADLPKLANRQAAFKTFMAGPDGRTADRVNQALQHLDIYQKAAMKLDNWHSGFLGGTANYGRAALMAYDKDPRYTSFATARDAVATELAAAFKGGNDPALASVEHWQSVLSAANSPEAVNAAVKTATGLLGGRIDAMNYRLQQSTGPNSDAYSLLTPKAAENFKKFSDDSFGEGPAVTPDEVKLSTTSKAMKLPDGYQDAVEQMLAKHPPGSLTVDDYINGRKEIDKNFANGQFESQLDPTEIKKYVDAYNQGQENPKTSIPVGSVPLSGFDKLRAEASESSVGNFLENATNAGTAGLVDLAAGQGSREAQRVSNDEHYIAAPLGEIAGSVLPITGMETGSAKLLSKLAPGLSETARGKLLASMFGNAAYGAARGFNGADDGEGLTGALEGGVTGALASGAAAGVTRGAKAFMNQRTIDALAQLKGVDLTTLQRLGLGRVENGLRNLPIVRGATADAMDSMNEDRGNQLLKLLPSSDGQPVSLPKGLSPTERNDFIYSKASDAYDAIKPQIQGEGDKTFANAVTALGAASKSSAFGKANFPDVLAGIKLAFDKDGNFNGDGFKNAMERLRDLKESYLTGAENSDNPLASREMAQRTDTAMKQLKLLVRRQVPENVANNLDQIDQVWAGKKVLEDAANRAAGTKDGIASPSDYIASHKKFDMSTNRNLTARGKMPGQAYTLASQHIMGSSGIPEAVGTRGAIETGVGLTGAGIVGASHPVIPAMVGGAGALAYTPGIKRITQAVLTGTRPKFLDNNATAAAIADFIRNHVTGN